MKTTDAKVSPTIALSRLNLVTIEKQYANSIFIIKQAKTSSET